MRYWLIDVPAHITEAIAVWYRLYFLVVVVIVAVVPTTMVIISLALYLVGIRWGW